ncbi:MAG: COX15/CtaA family protein [Burkholderiales bacterium]|nr:COX15/CtaA family protein [Burkholderiales bacterium]
MFECTAPRPAARAPGTKEAKIHSPSLDRSALGPAQLAAGEARSTRAVAVWLLACAALVFAMVVVGGVTRLTHSGLSIVEWQPIVGTLPPLTDAQWQETFAKYRETPEYRLVNRGMSLEAFKGIFWWEYFHRLLGRVIGLVFIVPLAWFALTRRIDRALALRLLGIFVLGGLQGAMGWYMVKSGLVDDPRVSHFRLTAHLSLAFLIFAAMLWTALGLLYPRRPEARGAAAAVPLRRLAWWITGLVAWMIVTGGFVAGIRAGKAYNTFPLMNGHVVPPEILMLEPWWKNFFYNMATVQFDHRLGAWALAFLVPWLWLRARRVALTPRARVSIALLFAAVAAQIALGIATLLHAVPVALGAAHQGVAVLVFAAALAVNHALAD